MTPVSSEGCEAAPNAVSSDVRTQTELGLEHAQKPRTAENPSQCAACVAAKVLSSTPRLMSRSDADRYLALSTDEVGWLIKTGQITVIRIRGQERFDRRDLDLLIETYKKTATRRSS
jgi:hypothetical protein